MSSPRTKYNATDIYATGPLHFSQHFGVLLYLAANRAVCYIGIQRGQKGGTQMECRRLSLPVTPEMAGRKVDTLLRKELHLSGTVIRRAKWLEDGILLDGVRVYVDRRVQAGQVLSVLVGDRTVRSGLEPVEGPLDIVYEDADLLVLNKAPGVPCHPGPGHYSDTIGNYIAFYYKKQGILADYHPVHRLDKGTSGLLVLAKHAHAQERLKAQLHTQNFRRTYLAVCCNAPAEDCGMVDAPIGLVEGSLMARRVDPAGQAARTHYQVLRRWAGYSLVRLTLETGRTHQIRVHMAYLGCPLAGDFLYGTEDPALIPRPALHSAEIALRHPVTDQALSWSCPMPADMARLLPECHSQQS